jgi:SAM-dependent methyltransferase
MAGEVPAVLIRIPEPQLQVYLQNHPFASGPDPEANDRSRRAIEQHLELRPAGRPASVRYLKDEEIKLAPEEDSRLAMMMDQLGIAKKEKQRLIEDYLWKAAFIPRKAKSVLVLGCGNGEELLFIRAVLPLSTITAIDLKENLKPGLKELLKISFYCCNIGNLPEVLPSGFDLIYSNHVLEHMYDPEAILTLLGKFGKSLVSALPMDGAQSAPFARKIAELARTSDKLHPLDVIMLDGGHPWKTNETDLHSTLTEAGFSNIRFYGRAHHLSRTFRGGRNLFIAQRLLGSWLHRLILGTLRSLLKLIFPHNPPEMVIKIFFAGENRLWFGANRLKNRFAPEVLIVAETLGPGSNV